MLKETFSKRKIGKKLVSVSMIGLVMVGSVVTPAVVDLIAPTTVQAAEATGREVTNITSTGSISFTDKDQGSGIVPGPGVVISEQTIDVQVNELVNEGDYITVVGKNTDFWDGGPIADESGTVIGELKKISQNYSDFSYNQTNVDSTTMSVNDTYVSTYQIIFNKDAENKRNLKFKVAISNKYVDLAKWYIKDDQFKTANVTFAVNVGPTQPINTTETVSTDLRMSDGRTPGDMYWLTSWYQGSVVNGELIPETFPLGFNQGDKDADFRYQVGDVITWNISDGSPIGLRLNDGVNVGDELQLTNTLDVVSPNWPVNKATNIGLFDSNTDTKVKILSASEKQLVVEITSVSPDYYIISKLDHYLKTVFLDTSKIDLETKRINDVQVTGTVTRNGQQVQTYDSGVKYAELVVTSLNGNGELIPKGSVNVKFEDKDGNPIRFDEMVVSGANVDTDYNIDPNAFTVDGYKFSHVKDGSAPTTGKVIEGIQEITLVYDVADDEYKSDMSLITRWVDEGDTNLKDQVEDVNPHEAGTIEGWEFVTTEIDDRGNVKHIFRKIPEAPKQVTTEWVDENDQPLKDKVTGETTQEPGAIAGYSFKETVNTDTGVKHIFTKDPEAPKQVTTEWVDENDQPLKDKVTGETTQEPGTVTGYTFKETVNTDSGVKHVFTKDPEPEAPKQVATEWVDENGNPLKNKVVSDKTLEPGAIAGYTFKETVNTDEGVKHIFTKDPEAPKLVTTEWVDEDGNPLRDKVVGDKTLEPGAIAGYTFKETINADGGVKHVFTKDPEAPKQVTTEWVDENGNPIKDKVTGDKTLEPGSIPGYTYKGTVDTDTGVKHLFEKIKEEQPVKETKQLPKTNATAKNVMVVSTISMLISGALALVLRKKKQ